MTSPPDPKRLKQSTLSFFIGQSSTKSTCSDRSGGQSDTASTAEQLGDSLTAGTSGGK